MDIKSAVILEVTINEKTCTFTMPSDASFGNVIDAAHQVYLKVIDMAQEAAKKEAPIKGDK